MNDRQNTLAYKLGRTVSFTLAACVCACIIAVAIAATIRFCMWLF